MLTCKKCKLEFPLWIEIQGKRRNLKNRSYCLICSPFKSNTGKTVQKTETLNLTKGKKICPDCKKDFNWTKNNVCPTCRANKRRKKNRELAINSLGGKCENCKINDFDVLTFHHKYPEQKLFCLCESWNKKWQIISQELQKCILLCANCHLKHHRK